MRKAYYLILYIPISTPCCVLMKQNDNHKNHRNMHTAIANLNVYLMWKKTFYKLDDLQKHMLAHIRKNHSNAIVVKKVLQNGDLTIHMRIHTEDKPSKCIQYGKEFHKKINI